MWLSHGKEVIVIHHYGICLYNTPTGLNDYMAPSEIDTEGYNRYRSGDLNVNCESV